MNLGKDSKCAAVSRLKTVNSILIMFRVASKNYISCTNLQAIDDRTIGHNPERLSLLKGGIVYSNVVV